MEAGRPAAIPGYAAFELIDGLNCIVLHNVIDIAAQQHMGMQGILHGAEEGRVFVLVQISAGEGVLDGVDARVGE